MLNKWLQEAHLDLGRYYIGKNYRKALQFSLQSLRYGPPTSYFFKNLFKIMFRMKSDLNV